MYRDSKYFKNPNRYPFCLAEGLSEQVKSNLWQEAVAFAHNDLYAFNDTGHPVTGDMIIGRTDEWYAWLVKRYKANHVCS